ncbi:MAG: hypothetical protein R3287_04790 [Anderseniella sp.]|nr:hypothetical protein [Anderseniella sp.]
MGMTELRRGIENPLEYVELISRLRSTLNERGFVFEWSTDMKAFNEVKLQARGSEAAPMFHHQMCDLDNKACWVRLSTSDGKTMGLNAYRVDFIDSNLADWATGWMAGLYMKAGQLMVPKAVAPAAGSRARSLSGWLVYHGELWVSREYRGAGDINEMMTYAGHLLAMLKWNPEAMWALVNHRIGVRGTGIQNGYPYAERSFLRWQWHPADIPENEWLLVATRSEFDHAVRERLEGGLMAIRD